MVYWRMTARRSLAVFPDKRTLPTGSVRSVKCQQRTSCLTNSSFGVADWHAATPSCLRARNTGWRSTGLHDPMPTPDTEPKYHSHTQWKCRLWWRPARKRDNADRRSEPVLRRWPPSFRSRGLSRSVRAFEPPLGPTHTLEHHATRTLSTFRFGSGCELYKLFFPIE